MKRFLRKLVWFGAVALALALVAAFYVRREWGGSLARELDERLTAQGIYVTWRSADWVPGPGIQVHELTLYRDVAKSHRLASLGNVTVIKGDAEWNKWEKMTVTVTNSRLTLAEGEAETKLENLGARLLIEPGKIDLQECRGKWQGMRLEVKGAYPLPARAGLTREGGASDAAASATTATAKKGRFDSIDLDWLKTAGEWMSVQPKKEAPLLSAEFHPLPDSNGMELTATLSGKGFRWLGPSWDLVEVAAKTSFGNSKSIIEISRAEFGFGGRMAKFSGEFDPSGAVLRIKKFQSSLDVPAFLKACVPESKESLDPVTSTGTWSVSGQGEIHVDQPGDSRWSGRMDLQGNLVHKTAEARVSLRNPSCTLKLEKREFTMGGLSAGLWEGKLSASKAKIRLATAKTRTRFETQLTLADARLESVMNSFGPAQKQPGTVQCSWSGAGAFDLGSFAGNGALAIQGAEFARVPLFGALARLLDKLSPGFGRDQTSKVEGSHRINKGKMYLESFTLDNAQTRIEAEGTIDLRRRYADLTARARMKGVVGFLATALAGGIDATGKGPVGDVKWEK